MSVRGLCFSLYQRFLHFLSGASAGLPACRPDSDFVVISFRVVSFCVKSGCSMMAEPVSGYCPVVLNQLYHLQGSSQSLVVDYSPLAQFSQTVIGYEGQGSTISPEFDSAIRILPGINVFSLKTPIFIIIFKGIKLLITVVSGFLRPYVINAR